VLLWPVAVQGDKAASEIAAAIAGFNRMGADFPRPDLLIVARGGGSIEDLMAFNDEAVVRAAAASVIPLISAVGHETDTTLIDFASDMRAPTPTAAAELAVPVRSELLAQTLDFERRALSGFARALEQRRRHLTQLARILPKADSLFATPRQRLDLASAGLGRSLQQNLRQHEARLGKAEARLRPAPLQQRIARLRDRLDNLDKRTQRCAGSHVKQWRSALDAVSRILEGVSYRAVLERGFALVRGDDGHVRRRAGAIKSGEALSLTFADGQAGAVATGKASVARSKKSPGASPSLFDTVEE
jgi:exodeoxyribonuclease VII large subunit